MSGAGAAIGLPHTHDLLTAQNLKLDGYAEGTSKHSYEG